MITNNPVFHLLHSDTAGSHYDISSEALDMVRGIMDVLRSAADPDQNSMEVYA